jgi:hypothetical protein
MAPTYGLVPHPPYQDRLITDAENGAWDNLGQRQVLGVRWHRMVGTLWGTDAWFRRGAASNGLTDYGVGVGSVDGSASAGLILRWNDPTGAAHPGCSPNRSPWASGPYTSCSYGDGRRNVEERGVNAVNRDGVSIEWSGQYDTPIDDASRDAVIALTAYWADQAHVPWSSFPIDPKRGYSFVKYHKEYCGNPYPPESCAAGVKACPGMVIVNETPGLYVAIAAYLKRYQEPDGVAPTPPAPEEDDPLADIAKSGYKFDPKTVWPNYNPGSAVSDCWAQYGEATGIWNPPGKPWNVDGGQGCTLFQFDGGPLISKTNSSGRAGIVVVTK